MHAIENGLDIPLGTQGAELLDTRYYDEDSEDADSGRRTGNADDDAVAEDSGVNITNNTLRTETDFRQRAAKAYAAYCGPFKNRFKWLPSTLFIKGLAKHLLSDAKVLIDVLALCGDWSPDRDAKLAKLVNLANEQHVGDKLLIFTQFADTARYLKAQLTARGMREPRQPQAQAQTPRIWPGASHRIPMTSATR